MRIGDPIAAAINLSEQNLPIFDISVPDAGSIPLVVGQNNITEPLRTITGSLLLDVRPAAVQGGRGDRPLGIVVQAGAGGALQVRQPALDLFNDLRMRLEQSAGAGLLAAVGVPGAEAQPGMAPGADRRPAGDRRDGAPAPAGGNRGVQR